MKNIIVGALVEFAANGVDPVDGCSSIYKNGEFVFSSAEERLTRHKYDGGFINSLIYGFAIQKLKVEDVDAFVFASYGEPLPKNKHHILKQLSEFNRVPESKIFLTPSHHELHAIQSFRNSNFQESLIIIADNEGLILGSEKATKLPLNPMERMSVYVGSPGGVQLLARYQDGFEDCSFGEAYRKFTYYLGFPSHQFAGKTMALSSYGKLVGLENKKLYTHSKNGELTTTLSNKETDPVKSVQQWLDSKNLKKYYSRKEGEKFENIHYELAAFIQREVKENFVSIIMNFASKFKLKNCCIGGGLAYNCQLISSIEKETKMKVFAPPCPGDQGISNGAILWYLENVVGSKKHYSPNPYLGSPAVITNNLRNKIKASLNLTVTEGTLKEIAKKAVSILIENKVVGLCVGNSESGRRALGNRSIICSISDLATVERVKQIKNREYFRPFGASCLDTYIRKYFGSPYPDNFMLRVSPVKVNYKNYFKNITHVDGTIRIQSVPSNSKIFLSKILKNMSLLDLEPILLNTSFNFDGEPIIDNCEQAFFWFEKHKLDALILPNMLIERTCTKK